jgi:hypothetical protein
MHIRLWFITSLFCAVSICCFANLSTACDQSNNTTNITDANVQARLKVQKNNAKDLALLVIGRYDPSTPQFARAKALYTDAQIQFNAFTSTMLDNYVARQKVDLSDTAQAAAKASKDFCDYVQSLNLVSRGIGLILEAAPVLVDIGLKLWNNFATQTTEERTAFANSLRPQITWKNWDLLINGD